MGNNLAEQERIGATIRGYRQHQGLSIEKLAELAQVSTKHLGAVERGKVDVGLGVLRQLCAALAIRLTDVIEAEALVPRSPRALVAKAALLLAEAEVLLSKAE